MLEAKRILVVVDDDPGIRKAYLNILSPSPKLDRLKRASGGLEGLVERLATQLSINSQR